MVSKYLKYSVLALSVSALLSGCGGGSSNEVSTSQQGRAVDGPLNGALVTFEDCNQTSTTEEDGTFEIPTECTEEAITVTGGIDTATGLTFTGTLKAPAPDSSTGVAIVSPLTTLVSAAIAIAEAEAQAQAQANNTTPEKVDIDAIKASLATSLGLSQNNLFADPMSDITIYKKSVQIQELVEQVQRVTKSLNGTFSDNELNTATLNAIVASMESQEDLITETSINSIIINTVKNLNGIAQNTTEKEKIATNLALLTSQIIFNNIGKVEGTLSSVTNPNDIINNEGIKADTKAQKAVSTAENLVSIFSSTLLSKEASEFNTLFTPLIESLKEDSNPLSEEELEALATAVGLDPTLLESALGDISQPIDKKYTNLEFGAYSLDLLKGSTLSEPLYVGLNEDIFKQELTISSENMSNNRDTIKLAFKVKILNANDSEIGSMNGIIDQVVLSFGDDGQINKATLPTNTNLELNAALMEGGATATKHKHHIVQSPIELAIDDQNKLSLEALLNSDSRFESTYADYAHHLDGTYKFDTTIYIKSNNLQIDNVNLTSNAKVDFGTNKYRFEGYSINAFFKNY